jgi:FtsP/CotA-like multicopper oxidase with cupredoxin domain
MAKKSRSQTFMDPTNITHTMSSKDYMEISGNSWPITMHLHGAEIRPTFDGNPLSWIDNNPFKEGQVGVATFSLDEDCYYNSFDKIKDGDNYNPPNIKLIGEVGNSNYKINRYPNRQNPGNLWYHDHAMHLTDYNVRFGLAGFYILRDEKV